MNDQHQPPKRKWDYSQPPEGSPQKTANERKEPFWKNKKTIRIFKYARYAIMIICGLILWGLFIVFINHSEKYEDQIGTLMAWFIVILVVFIITTISPAIVAEFQKNTITKTVYLSVTSELARIDSLEGHDFEYYVARLLQAYGFENVSVTQGSGDYGVDIIAYAGEEKIAIQCKHYAKPVGIKAVQEVYAGKMHYNAAEAVVVTNSTFTDAAFTLAQETGVRLWDRDSLKQMLTEIIEREKQAANTSSK